MLVEIHSWQAQESAGAAMHSCVCSAAVLSLHQPGLMLLSKQR